MSATYDASQHARQLAVELGAIVDGARFHLSRKGYDQGEVDAFLQRCADTVQRVTSLIDEGSGNAREDRAWVNFWDGGGDDSIVDDNGIVGMLGDARFHLRKKGYDVGEVDELLGKLHRRATELDAAVARRLEGPPVDDHVTESHEFDLTIVDHPLVEPADPPVEREEPVPPAARRAPDEHDGPGLGRVPRSSTPVDEPRAGGVSGASEEIHDTFVAEAIAEAYAAGSRQGAACSWLSEAADQRDARLDRARWWGRPSETARREADELRRAVAEECLRIIGDAEREAERALVRVAEQVQQRLAKVRVEAGQELERIVAEQADRSAPAGATAEVGRASSGPPPAADSSFDEPMSPVVSLPRRLAGSPSYGRPTD